MPPSHLPDFAPSVTWFLFTSSFANALVTYIDPHHPPPRKKKEEEKIHWLDCAAILETNYFYPSIQCQTCKKILSQHLHFLSSSLLLNLSASSFHDHQNTAIILSKVTYDLLFALFIFELCSLPWGWPAPSSWLFSSLFYVCFGNYPILVSFLLF